MIQHQVESCGCRVGMQAQPAGRWEDGDIRLTIIYCQTHKDQTRQIQRLERDIGTRHTSHTRFLDKENARLEREIALSIRLRQTERNHAQRLDTALRRLMITGSAATGFLMSEFSDMHGYIEEIMGRPILNAALGEAETAAEVREKAHPDFVQAIRVAHQLLASACND